MAEFLEGGSLRSGPTHTFLVFLLQCLHLQSWSRSKVCWLRMYLVKGRQLGKVEIKGSLHDFLFRQTILAVIFAQVRCCSQFCELTSHSELQKSPFPLCSLPLGCQWHLCYRVASKSSLRLPNFSVIHVININYMYFQSGLFPGRIRNDIKICSKIWLI